jgi:hypothetical protein
MESDIILILAKNNRTNKTDLFIPLFLAGNLFEKIA